MARVSIEHGSEGPRYDPYSWTEITFTTTAGKEIVLRQGGLGYDRLTYDGKTITSNYDSEPNVALHLFEQLTGMPAHKALDIPDQVLERKLRAHSCDRVHIQDVSGYPGETFTMCMKCKTIFNSRFNRSAVE